MFTEHVVLFRYGTTCHWSFQCNGWLTRRSTTTDSSHQGNQWTITGTLHTHLYTYSAIMYTYMYAGIHAYNVCVHLVDCNWPARSDVFKWQEVVYWLWLTWHIWVGKDILDTCTTLRSCVIGWRLIYIPKHQVTRTQLSLGQTKKRSCYWRSVYSEGHVLTRHCTRRCLMLHSVCIDS